MRKSNSPNPPPLTIVGLGYGKNGVTKAGAAAIRGADVLLLKTALSRCAAAFKRRALLTFDSLYESAADFEELNALVMRGVLEHVAPDKSVVFCVPGDGISDGAALALLKEVPGAAFLPGGAHPLLPFAGGEYTAVTAVSFSARGAADNIRAHLITEIDNAFLASDVKLKALEYWDYGDSAFIYTAKGGAVQTTVGEIDRASGYGEECAVLLPPPPALTKSRYCFADLLNIMDRLLAPDGCPWDREQTHESIRMNAVEEAYELVDAIDSGEEVKLIEEAGDLLLQPVFHAKISGRRGGFTAADMLSALCEKLITRHTHIFGGDSATGGAEALMYWEKAKAKEKNTHTAAQGMRELPKVFPAVLRAQKAQKKAAKSGMDFNGFTDAAAALFKEVEELRAAEGAEIEDEAGDVLFSALNLARLKGAEGELALQKSVDKFIRRFAAVEQEATKRGIPMKKENINKLNEIWEEVKKEERKKGARKD